MEGSTSKKTNEPPKRADHKRNIKFPNPFLLQERYQIRKREDLLIRGLTWMNPHQQQQHVSKQRPPVHVVPPLTPSVYKIRAKLKEEGLQCKNHQKEQMCSKILNPGFQLRHSKNRITNPIESRYQGKHAKTICQSKQLIHILLESLVLKCV